MNRPGKHCEVAIEETPAARAAGQEEADAGEFKPKRPVARPLDVATRLLQLVSLFVLFVFGLVGASIFTLRHTGMSHPALQRSTSLVVNRLTERIVDHGNAVRYSPPVYFSLVAMRRHGNGGEGEIADVAKRFAPDFVVFDAQLQAREDTRSIEKALPGHACIATEEGTASCVCFDTSVWSQREHGVHPIGMEDAHETTRPCAWEVSWARFEREVSTRSTLAFHGRHWHNETLTIASVRQLAPADASCDCEATLADAMGQLQGNELSSSAPVIITNLPSNLQHASLSVALVGAFEHLGLAHNPLPARESRAPHVVANSRMRPVSTTVISSSEAATSQSLFPVSVVYELLPPQRHT